MVDVEVEFAEVLNVEDVVSRLKVVVEASSIVDVVSEVDTPSSSFMMESLIVRHEGFVELVSTTTLGLPSVQKPLVPKTRIFPASSVFQKAKLLGKYSDSPKTVSLPI